MLSSARTSTLTFTTTNPFSKVVEVMKNPTKYLSQDNLNRIYHTSVHVDGKTLIIIFFYKF